MRDRWTLLGCLLVVIARVLAGLYAPITDSDEVYNYWEPLHYLQHRIGFRTWEYVPTYAIRSYAFLLFPFLTLTTFLQRIGQPKILQFYGLRVFLALLHAASDIRLAGALRKQDTNTKPLLPVLYLLITAAATGTFIASPALLPSSYAMICTTYFLAEIMERTPVSFLKATGAISIASILGWPFAAAFALPYYAHEAWLFLRRLYNQKKLDGLALWVQGLGISLTLLWIMASIDSLFYQSSQIVPWNIIRYNVLNPDAGPELYGVEPVSYFFKTGLLNFNGLFLLALLSPCLLFVSQPLRDPSRTAHAVLPFYVLFTIFSSQPHKEERFLYPAYPSLMLAAALVLAYLYRASKAFIRPIWSRCGLVAVLGLFIFLSVARSVAMVTHYGAPMQLFSFLPVTHSTGSIPRVLCLGDEWYQFPSHYHLPKDVYVRWIKSTYHGTLPHYYDAFPGGLSSLPDPSLGVNNRNRSPAAHVFAQPQTECDFIVLNGEAEKNRLFPNKRLHVIQCLPLLDKEQTSHPLARIFGLPPHKRAWSSFCLYRLQRRSSS